MYLRGGTGRVFNCTFACNDAGRVVGGLATGGDSVVPRIANSIFWGNTAVGGPLQHKNLALDNGTINNSCVEGWTGEYGGVGNHGLDPRFVDGEGGDLRLVAGSPCIDAGDNEAVTEPQDLDGNPRILNDVVDMGAYESVCDNIEDLTVTCRGAEPGAGTVRASVTTTLPKGSQVYLRLDGGEPGPGPDDALKPAPIKAGGRGKTKWKRQTGPVTVCPDGCPASCRMASCD